MPLRHFDGDRLRSEYRAGDARSVAELAERIGGVSREAVTRWMTGAATPGQEKLPAIAAALGKPIDLLFPREGAPDLADLRCDAGYTQREAAEKLLGSSHIPLLKAEKGRSRLNTDFVSRLAAGYRVTEPELLAAQDRSFGVEPAVQERPGETLATRLNMLLRTKWTAATAPSDAYLAEAVNGAAGRPLITAGDLTALREDRYTLEDLFPAPADQTAFRESLARAVGESPLYFCSPEDIARNVAEGLMLLNNASIVDLALAARGAETGGVDLQMLRELAAFLAATNRPLPKSA